MYAIDEDINISLEDAVNLLIKSIAMEEMSLSRLIDTERNKILHILNRTDLCPRDLIDINNSVDRTLKDITKLQILLQYKLESINKIMPYICCPSPCDMPVVCCPDSGKASGNAEGIITDGFNEFYNCTAKAEFCAEVSNLKESFLIYSTNSKNVDISLNGCVKEIVFGENEITLKGCANGLRKDEKSNIEGTCFFVIMIQYCGSKIKTFDIIIMSKNPLLQHRSGIITVKSSEIKIC